MTGRIAIVCAGALAAACAPAAQAATKEVAAGSSAAAVKALHLKGVPADAAFNVFARRTVTIHAGDRVRWKINGDHTVTFLNGHRRPGLLAADTAHKVAGVTDAAGSPFWFNGKPTLLYNPAVLAKRGGTTFKRGRLAGSGLVLGSTKARSYTLRFTLAGTFSYVCLAHPSMKGTVVVRRAGARIPRRSADRAAAKAELKKVVKAAIVKEGAVVVTAQAGANRFIQAGNDGTGFTVAKFFPPEASVLAGVPITLRVAPRSDADHTFTFGPADLVASLRTGLVAKKGARRFELSPQAVWASDATLPAFTPTVHGNGFLNTGILDTGALGDSPLSLSSNATVTFSTAGSYTLFCLIHPNMQAKVDVVTG